MSEAVNNPSHYSPNGVDSFMHMKDQMGREAFEGFLQGNVIKYVQRHKFKGKPVEDLNKAFFYLAHLYFECGGDLHALTKTTNHAFRHYGNTSKDPVFKGQPADPDNNLIFRGGPADPDNDLVFRGNPADPTELLGGQPTGHTL